MSQSTGQTDSNHNGLPASGRTAPVGYKHPPANKRFAKGKSGNRKGRPKGTPNVADILARLFNKKISVRGGYGTQLMGACEAIIRNAVAKAQLGDGRMLTTVIGILEMLGATNVVTAEEREKRTGKLPRPYTMDEYELTNAESREKERQYYRLIAERDEVMACEPIAIPSPIQEGDELKLQSKSNEALAAYCQQIAVCQIQLANNANDRGLNCMKPILFRRNSEKCFGKIEKLFSKNDWEQPPENVPARTPANVGVTEIKAREYDDVHSGDRLFEQGNFDEAFKVYRRAIALCQANLANGRVNLQAVDDREIAISRICGLVFMFTLDHNLQKAVEVADEAIKMLPNSAGLNLRRAHAVMFLNNPDEARALYKQYRVGKAAPERTWHSVILEDFSTMRNAGLSHPLMDEIEQELSG
jgi:tetratricopeptide (TPR) repeat protein